MYQAETPSGLCKYQENEKGEIKACFFFATQDENIKGGTYWIYEADSSFCLLLIQEDANFSSAFQPCSRFIAFRQYFRQYYILGLSNKELIKKPHT